LDSDLFRMTDDGGPPAPDPARWSDPNWRDNLGVFDTFVGNVLPAPVRPVGIKAGWLARWGLVTAILFLAAAVAALMLAPSWSDGGLAPSAWAALATGFAFAAIMCVHRFDRASPSY
jgi:hypothetical protein